MRKEGVRDVIRKYKLNNEQFELSFSKNYQLLIIATGLPPDLVLTKLP